MEQAGAHECHTSHPLLPQQQQTPRKLNKGVEEGRKKSTTCSYPYIHPVFPKRCSKIALCFMKKKGRYGNDAAGQVGRPMATEMC